MAVDPRIKAFNRVKNRLRQIVPELSAARGAALLTGVPVIIEPLDEIAGTLAVVVPRVDEELEKLWLQQSKRRLQNYIMHHHRLLKKDVQ